MPGPIKPTTTRPTPQTSNTSTPERSSQQQQQSTTSQSSSRPGIVDTFVNNASNIAGLATVEGGRLAHATTNAASRGEQLRQTANTFRQSAYSALSNAASSRHLTTAQQQARQQFGAARNLTRQANQATRSASRLNTAGQVLGVLGGTATAIDQGLNSSAQTNAGKVVSGTLAGTASYALGSANPYVAAADAAAGLLGAPDTPGNVLNKSIDTITTVGEAAITRNTGGLEDLHERNLSGQNGPVFQAAAEAGEYWAEHGVVGGIKNAWDILTD